MSALDRPPSGILRKTLEVYCAGCEHSILGLPGRHENAREELRQDYGWSTRKGFWNCPDCKDDPSKVNRAAYGLATPAPVGEEASEARELLHDVRVAVTGTRLTGAERVSISRLADFFEASLVNSVGEGAVERAEIRHRACAGRGCINCGWTGQIEDQSRPISSMGRAESD